MIYIRVIPGSGLHRNDPNWMSVHPPRITECDLPGQKHGSFPPSQGSLLADRAYKRPESSVERAACFGRLKTVQHPLGLYHLPLPLQVPHIWVLVPEDWELQEHSESAVDSSLFPGPLAQHRLWDKTHWVWLSILWVIPKPCDREFTVKPRQPRNKACCCVLYFLFCWVPVIHNWGLLQYI